MDSPASSVSSLYGDGGLDTGNWSAGSLSDSFAFSSRNNTSGIGSVGGGVESTWDSIRVLIRVRPLGTTTEESNALLAAQRSGGRADCVELTSRTGIHVNCGSISEGTGAGPTERTFDFTFDAVLGPSTSQEEVYDLVKDAVSSILEGINATIFAYGQTGSGKTYTMYGPGSAATDLRSKSSWGIVPRAVEQILNSGSSENDFQLTVACLQVYNEQVFDMVRDPQQKTPLTIREDKKEVHVGGLSEYRLRSVEDAMMVLTHAEAARIERGTIRNTHSSRSHAILRLSLTRTTVHSDGGEVTYKSKLHLVDLAGSERYPEATWGRTPDEEHKAEQASINLSLLTLGKCISALSKLSKSLVNKGGGTSSRGSSAGASDRKSNTSSSSNIQSGNNIHIPYRESKLTRLLRSCLGGRARTALIATVAPLWNQAEETLRTLRFAARAASVVVRAKASAVRPADHVQVRALQAQVRQLQAQLASASRGGGGANAMANLLLARSETARLRSSLRGVLGVTWEVGGGVSSASDEETGAMRRALIEQKIDLPSTFRRLSEERLDCLRQALRVVEEDSASGDTTYIQESGSSTGIAMQNQATHEKDGLSVISDLERSLAREQNQTQLLSNQNDGLIRELEALKTAYMQLSNRPAMSIPQPTLTSSTPMAAAALISPALVRRLTETSRQLKSYNETLLAQVNEADTTVKRFFKFQIEEDELRHKLEAVFAATSAIKQSAIASASTASETITALEAQLDMISTDVPPIGASFGSPTRGGGNNALPALVPISGPTFTSSSAPAITSSLSSSLHASPPVSNATTKMEHSRTLPELVSPSRTAIKQRAGNALLSPLRSLAVNEVGSLGGEESNINTEEQLRRELKKAKKKAEERDRLAEWTRNKEKRLLEEQLARQEKTKILLEQEAQREERRISRVQATKAKLAAYQGKVKSEAEKLQTLVALGIDPRSLNL